MIETAQRASPNPLADLSMQEALAHTDPPAGRREGSRWVWRAHWVLLAAAAVLYALHFVHLNADFPNHSPWVDWSKYTDEGWYGDAAIRHYMTGHWYWKGDFNPAVALPVWPALELVWFKLTGVSPAAARTLTLVVFGLTLAVLYRLIERHTRPRNDHSGPALAAPLAVLLLCANALLFVFERMAILEPLLILLTLLALLAASHLHPLRQRRVLPALALAVLLPAMVLTKTTAICLFPAVFYMVWARAGYRLGPALRLSVPPAAVGLALWCAYFYGFVRPHYLADYRYLFSANAYTGIELEPLFQVVLNTLGDGVWMGGALYAGFFAVVALALFWRPRLLTNPLVPALLLWVGGYFAFLAYHNNLQPRYYMVVAVPITVLVALGTDAFRQAAARDRPGRRRTANALAVVATLAIAVPGMVLQADFLMHPTYDFRNAAEAIRRIVRAQKGHSDLVLSISGSDLTLMTGLPSIDDDFGTMDLGERVKVYRPGWYVSWNEVDDDKADALTPYFHLERVAAWPVMDDADRNLLILYRLDPAPPEPVMPRRKRHIPKPLVTKMGQQPSVMQLDH
jgi:hypothetical protein